MKFPGNDPKTPPGEGWEWRGKGDVGSREGNWYNPATGESLHPDLNHPGDIGPHWDYWKKGVDGSWRIFPDNSVKLK